MARVALVSLGCPKNLVDSEIMLGLLEEAGHDVVEDATDAEVVIVNTCAFIEPAVEEAVEALLDTVDLKDASGTPRVICAGCLTERHGEELAAELPEVDAFIGPGAVNEIVDVVERCIGKGQLLVQTAPPWLYSAGTPRFRSGREWLSCVKIADGCSHECAYCMIPKLRGPFRSRSAEDIRREILTLIDDNVREICLIAQDTSMWGADLDGDWTLARLLRFLDLKGWDGWLRLQYLHPDRITRELTEAIAEVDQVVPYFDIPLQHASENILRSMGRRGDADSYLEMIAGIREHLPEAALRTTFIVGYPGETEDDFRTLLEFIADARFDRLSAFRYWDEPETRAAELPDQVSESEMLDRLETLTLRQAEISQQINQDYVGEQLRVLVEREDDETDHLVGRSYRDAPDVDGEVVITGGSATSGEFAPVQITGAEIHDLSGVVPDSGHNE